jgi:hypothetical protein
MLEKIIPSEIRLTVYLVATLAITGAGFVAYDAIYSRGYDAASVVYQKEALDREAANNLGIKQAEASLRGSIETLILEKEKLEDEIARLNREAAQDPGADDGALGLGSVQRLNSVR